jgi:hypothetical protein
MVAEPTTAVGAIKAALEAIASVWKHGALLLWSFAAAAAVALLALLVASRLELAGASELSKTYGVYLLLAAPVLAVLAGFKTYSERQARPVAVIWQNFSFWQGNQLPTGGPMIQVHLQGVLTNPSAHRGLVITRLALFRPTPLGIFSTRECANFAIADSGPFDLPTVPPRHSVNFRVDHFHPGRYPRTQRHIWIGLLMVDQSGSRSVKFARLRHSRTPI